MTDITTNFEDHSHLMNHLQENYAPLIKEEATKIAKKTLEQGGGVIEYEVPKPLMEHLIKEGMETPDKKAIRSLFREQVENHAFDLLMHERNTLYGW